MNAITYKNVFPLIKENKLWLGGSRDTGNKEFRVPDNYEIYASDYRIADNGTKYIGVKGVKWFTNLEHGRRHQPIQLMTMADNKKFNKKVIKNPEVYQRYDNYDAIEVSYTDAIPSDYDGQMGVPISFLDKYSPEQFEILGITESQGVGMSNNIWDKDSNKKHPLINGNKMYARIFIKHKNT